jgi:hypothetical protein
MLRSFRLPLPLPLALVGAALVCAAPAPTARGAGKERRYSNSKYGVTVDAPAGWALSPHTGYPDILMVLVHPSGARISLAAADTALGSARELAEQNRRGLEAQGLTITAIAPAPRDGVIVDALPKTGADRLRQYYVLRTADDKTRQGLVLTLTAPASLLPTMQPTFSSLIGRLLTDASPPR